MNAKNEFEEKVLKEIREINVKDRIKLFEIIHNLRLRIATYQVPEDKNIKRFAGMW